MSRARRGSAVRTEGSNSLQSSKVLGTFRANHFWGRNKVHLINIPGREMKADAPSSPQYWRFLAWVLPVLTAASFGLSPAGASQLSVASWSCPLSRKVQTALKALKENDLKRSTGIRLLSASAPATYCYNDPQRVIASGEHGLLKETSSGWLPKKSLALQQICFYPTMS